MAAVTAVALLAFPAGVWAADAFTDVADGNVHHDAVAAIRDAGVTQGCAEGRYCPDAAVRRDQMASFMNRLGALSGQAPVVNAATAEQAADSAALGGTAAQELLDRLAALETQLADATARIGTLETDNADLQARVGTLETDNADLQTLLAGVTRSAVDGRDTLRFAAMNLQVVNGTGSTDGEPDGLGNLIVGYNAPRPITDPAVDRAGSHYLVVGDRHHWPRFGGILAGFNNTASGDWASVTGGSGNTASGPQTSVSGGLTNTASGNQASVSGGTGNTANGDLASILGGVAGTASGIGSSVAGGHANTAIGFSATVAGGRDGTVSGNYDSRIGNTEFLDN